RGWRRPSRATGTSSTRPSAEFVAELQSADAARPSGSGRSGVRRRLKRRGRRGPPAPGDPRNIGWLYVLPGLAFYGLFTLAPLVHTVYYSLFSWDGLTAKTYVGLENYSSALTDAALRSSFVHSAVLIALYDAARVAGAGATREFFAVTLPGLRGEVLVALVLTTINALRSFDIVYNTTAGGPGGSTLVPSMYMYQNAFLYNKVGYAAAVA